jgi:hypothetical protein
MWYKLKKNQPWQNGYDVNLWLSRVFYERVYLNDEASKNINQQKTNKLITSIYHFDFFH